MYDFCIWIVNFSEGCAIIFYQLSSDHFMNIGVCFAGSILAIASSYMYEDEGGQPPAPDQIFIRNVTTAETKPK